MLNIRLFASIALLILSIGSSVARGVHYYDLWDPSANEKESDEYIILAKVEKEEDNHLNAVGQAVPTSEVKYTVTVFCEIRGRVADNATITIEGTRSPKGHSANAHEIPLMPPGAVFVMAIQKNGGANRFIYESDEILPIGIKSPKIVEEKDRQHIQRAFGLLVELCRQHAAAAQHDKAIALMRDPDYYAWALGAYVLAKEGTAADLHVLFECYFVDTLTIRQLLWLDYVLGHVMSQAVAPSAAELHQLLINYLWKRQ